MGVHVTQDEAKGWEFVDRVIEQRIAFDALYYPCGVPANTEPETLAQEFRLGQGLPDGKEVADEEEQEHGKKTCQRASPRLDNSSRCLVTLDQGIADPVGSQPTQGKEERQRQIVSDSRGNSGEARKKRHHEVAEVVVVDAEARSPPIVRGERRRLKDAVEHHEVHELFGAHELRRILAQHRIPGEKHQEEDFHDIDLMTDGFSQVFESPPKVPHSDR